MEALDAPLFALTAADTGQWAVRHSTTGQLFYTGAQTDCEAWAVDNPTVKWVVVEPVTATPKPLDEYIRRGMMRNYPGEKKRKIDRQLALI